MTVDDLLATTAYQVGSMLRSAAVILIGEGEQLAARACYLVDAGIDEPGLAAIHLAWQNNRPVDRIGCFSDCRRRVARSVCSRLPGSDKAAVGGLPLLNYGYTS